MGGLGKTALAQAIYGDEKVKKHFELTMWVCISQEFDVKVIIEKITESITKKRLEPDLQLDTLQSMLREKIDGKRYLLVMDDVWNVDRMKWVDLKQYLMGGAKGSRILITTRTHEVAQTFESVFSHHLKELNEDNSWELFSKVAFSNESEMIENSKLVVIGKEIATKLKGFPLAIRVIGSYLYCKKSEKVWLSLKDNELNTIMQQSNEIQSILKIGFNQLSSGLKNCFTYCVLYPKGYEIPKDELIKQWMAQGFIQPQNEKAIEVVGDDYFEELLRRSFFQDIQKDKWGEIKKFKMHDLMHDLAYSVVENDCMLANDDIKSIDNRIRHVSFFPDSNERLVREIAKSLIEAKNLRTLIYLPIYYQIDLCNHLRLRTLNLVYWTYLPKCIGKMKHLRYLEFSHNSIDFLPKFVTRLYNLETLIIRYCKKLRELPSEIKDLINLRHLDIMHCNSDYFSHMPKGLGSMTSLQTMNRFVLGDNKGGELSELNGLNNLRGSLKIDQLQFCRTSDLKNAKYLEKKSGIRILELYWYTFEMECKLDDEALESYVNTYEMYRPMIYHEDEKVLECLKPHPKLQKICIGGYRGEKLCDWLSFDSIANLAIIKLCYLKNLQHLPRFDQFPFLKHLRLKGLWSIEYIDNNNYDSSSTTFFPSLEKLIIIQLPKLKKWWKGEIIDQNTSFPTMNSLSQLKIHECRQLGSIPQHGPLQSLDICAISLQLFELVIKMATTNITVGEDSSSSANNVFIRSLSSLRIAKIDCEFLPHHLFSNMTHFESLVIDDCMNLKMSSDDDDGVIWKELRSLRTLELRRIPKLEYLPKGFQYMTALEHLELRYCSNLVCIKEIGHLNSLSQLIIDSCPNLTSLPKEMVQLTSLSYLEIGNCARLTSLPQEMSQLTSLSSLTIYYCPNLTSIPKELRHITRTL